MTDPAGSSRPGYAFGAATDPGRVRDHNEDFNIVDPAADGRAYDLFVLCDGMGGSARGEVASELAAGGVQRRVRDGYEGGDASGLVERAILGAHEDLLAYQGQHREAAGMGCTVVTALLEGDRLTLGHVGDSRAYLALADGRFERLTRDHSWAEELFRANALKSEEEVRNHHQRHILTRFLGGREANEVEVDLAERSLAPGDRLLLCSDGLWDMVRDPRIHDILTSHPPGEAARELVAEANREGGRDNITVIVIHRTA